MRQIQALGFEPLTKTVKVRDKDITVRTLTVHEREKCMRAAGDDLNVLTRLIVHRALDLEAADMDTLLLMPGDVFDAIALAVGELNTDTLEAQESLEGESVTSAPESDGSTP